MAGWHGSTFEQCTAMRLQRTVIIATAAADYYYMITVQLQTKMYSWTEWLAWLCLLSNAHATHCCNAYSTQQIIVT
jgi:hypothetical protein